jgi:hypothetical protein
MSADNRCGRCSNERPCGCVLLMPEEYSRLAAAESEATALRARIEQLTAGVQALEGRLATSRKRGDNLEDWWGQAQNRADEAERLLGDFLRRVVAIDPLIAAEGVAADCCAFCNVEANENGAMVHKHGCVWCEALARVGPQSKEMP